MAPLAVVAIRPSSGGDAPHKRLAQSIHVDGDETPPKLVAVMFRRVEGLFRPQRLVVFSAFPTGAGEVIDDFPEYCPDMYDRKAAARPVGERLPVSTMPFDDWL